MGLFNGQRRFTEPTQTLWRIMKIQFHKSTMTQSQKQAYEELVKQVDLRVTQKNCEQQEITVPASIKAEDASKALKLIKLEFDSHWDFHIKWEGEAGRRTLMTEKKNPPLPPADTPPPAPPAPEGPKL